MSEPGLREHELTQAKLAIGSFLVICGLAGGVLLDEFTIFVLTKFLIFAIFGVAFNFAFGLGGIASFGHAAFFGIGGYGLAMTLQHFEQSLLIALLVVIGATVVYGVFVGLIATRGRGIYFALLTFAFAQGLYEFVIRTPDITGASRGLFVSAPPIPGINLSSTIHIYYISLALLTVTMVAGYRILQSPFGKSMIAMSHNQDRAQAIGYPIRMIKIIAFTASGLVSAFAGLLFGLHNAFVTPDMLFFIISVEVVIIAIIGGMGFLWGPIPGAAILIAAEHYLADLGNFREVAIGILFIFIVLFAPEGIAGAIQRVHHRVRNSNPWKRLQDLLGNKSDEG